MVALVQLPDSRRANWTIMSLEMAHRYHFPDGGRPNTDLWPDVSEYSPSELYPAPGLNFASGEQAKLFSSRNPSTVQRYIYLSIYCSKINIYDKAFQLDGPAWCRWCLLATIRRAV